MVTTVEVDTLARDLFRKVEAYLPPERVELVRQALDFAQRCHEGQVRATGEPYIIHPLHTALFLTDLRLDSTTLAAALLHDVMEDCGVKHETLAARFGDDVAKLVDGVTKLSRVDLVLGEDLNTLSPEESRLRAASLRKMLVSMAQDIRVVLIKLADRLHNMKTLDALPLQKRQRIAQETLEIYAPLAHRLGIAELKWQLEDLAFRHLHPEEYRAISARLSTKRREREVIVDKLVRQLRDALVKANVKARVSGRPKHIYSIYRKSLKYSSMGKGSEEIYDLYAVRVLVRTTADCYNALGVVHNMWRPLPGQFDDYIANPKENNYQSLHTTVMTGTSPVEVQIRTYRMHQVAEYGVAAHWRYKEGTSSDLRFEERMTWLRQLLEWQRDVSGAEEFLESVKMDIFKDQVFVYTPKGDIIELPAGATPLDFAYKVHTELGHRCVGAKVNARLVSLDYQLQNGDTVEVLSSRTARGPSLDWLNPNRGYVSTASAREKIRQWFRKQERSANIDRGRELLSKEMRRLGLSEDDQELAKLFKLDNVDEFYANLGTGSISVAQVLNRLTQEVRPAPLEEIPIAPRAPQAPSEPAPSGTVQVLGVGDLLTRMAHCCNPIPGDEVIGYITRSRGITVHRKSCPNVLNEDEKDRLIPVEWGKAKEVYSVPIVIRARDRVGLLRDLTTQVAAEGVNVTASSTATDPATGVAVMGLTVQTTGISQLSKLFSKLESVRGVISVSREQVGSIAPDAHANGHSGGQG